jgi:hypothetical protein
MTLQMALVACNYFCVGVNVCTVLRSSEMWHLGSWGGQLSFESLIKI